MTENQASAEFQAIPFPVRSLTAAGAAPTMNAYRVYRTPADCVSVEAETAAEAMKASGIDTPWRIVRYIPGREVLLDRKVLLG